jgi:hypothetical protein
MKVESYEQEVLKILCNDVVPNSVLHESIVNPESISYKFTGEGYYLDIKHKELPIDRIVCDKPTVIGQYQEQEIGFIVFIENGIISLECYNYSNKGIPEGIRTGSVKISTT